MSVFEIKIDMNICILVLTKMNQRQQKSEYFKKKKKFMNPNCIYSPYYILQDAKT